MSGHFVARIVNQARQRILQASVVISETRPEYQNVEPIGSGILLNLQGEYFLVTAAHVLNHSNWQKLVIPTAPCNVEPNPMVFLQGELISSYITSKHNKRYDFSILRFYPKMHKHLQQLNPFVQQNILMNHTLIERDHYIITGYPWRHIKRRGNAFYVDPFTLQTYGVSKKRYQKNKFEADLFALVQYQRRLQRFSDGQIIQARNPQGISGCGLYYVPQFNEYQLNTPELYLIGIMIENHQDKGFMAAFKIDLIIEIIRYNFQLASLSLPFTKSEGNIGTVYQGDYWERVEAEETANGITPIPEQGVNRILRSAPIL